MQIWILSKQPMGLMIALGPDYRLYEDGIMRDLMNQDEPLASSSSFFWELNSSEVAKRFLKPLTSIWLTFCETEGMLLSEELTSSMQF